ncbi:lamin tail domain-containing protein [Nannocystis punicea]|uniref:Lamin tail domain-containing protein n=1 Tax=Nannocystis punicea TaxID=2995304 RepID=A0ABY7H363_9BACT|nr:lamin tail domain-containing protein [Nannocystis poenicansa]WAS93672.1 lamin tail domain-containing protein [Nannocystis poenicansa]
MNNATTDDAPMEATSEAGTEPDDGTTTTGGDEPQVTSEGPGAASVCGDGVVEGDELCDGAEVGGMSCADVDPGFVGPLNCASDCLSFDVSECEGSPIEWVVTLNELTSKGAESGPYAGRGDAIELLNAGGAPADLSGWQLSDEPMLPDDKTYVFPAGTTLMPGERLVLVELDPMTGEGELPFGLSSNTEETLTLVDGDDAVIDALTFEGVAAMVSWCRLPDGIGSWGHCEQTLGAANTEALTICGNGVREGSEACDGLDVGAAKCADRGFTAGAMTCTPQCLLDTSMCMSDVMATINELESTNDDIELFNAGAVPVDMSGWILTDKALDGSYDLVADVEKLVFAAGTKLAPGQFMVVKKGKNPGLHEFGLSSDGDTVTLLKPDLTPVSQVTYGFEQATLSFCRIADGPEGSWSPGCKPTLGAANSK